MPALLMNVSYCYYHNKFTQMESRDNNKNLVKTCGYVELFSLIIQNIISIIFFSGYTKMKKNETRRK